MKTESGNDRHVTVLYWVKRVLQLGEIVLRRIRDGVVRAAGIWERDVEQFRVERAMVGEKVLIFGHRVVADLGGCGEYVTGILRQLRQKYRRLVRRETNALYKDLFQARAECKYAIFRRVK